MSATVENFDGLCGIIRIGNSDLQLRCQYELGHHGPCTFEKYVDKWPFRICSSCRRDPEEARERGFIDSVVFHKKES